MTKDALRFWASVALLLTSTAFILLLIWKRGVCDEYERLHPGWTTEFREGRCFGTPPHEKREREIEP